MKRFFGIFLVFGALVYAQAIHAEPLSPFSRQQVTLQEHGDILVSPTLTLERPFNAVVLKLPRVVMGMQVRYGKEGRWEDFEVHDDGFGPEAFLLNSPSQSVQFRMPAGFSNDALALRADIFFQEEQPFQLSDYALYAGPLVAQGQREVIKRKDWGADESYRYWNPDVSRPTNQEGAGESENENGAGRDPCADFDTRFADELGITKIVDRSISGDELLWPLQYASKIRKIVIHHTDSEVRDINGDDRINSRDYKEIVRAIYRFHALSRGWGDVGYNYLIDPLGNVYEGRAGGDKVIGAHVLCHNNGALGIAVIGNYQDNELPEPALQAVTELVARKAKENGLDPTGSGLFRGKDLQNIVGHRDLRPTACPGQKLYGLLPQIRKRADAMIRSGNFGQDFQVETLDYNAEPMTEIPMITLKPTERKKLTLEFKNTGQKTWGPDTWLHVALNNNPNARLVPLLADKAFVAANLNEPEVAPGATGTFEIELEGGYKGGNYSFLVAPVVNGRYRVSRAMVDIPFGVEAARYDYEYVKSDLPKGTIFQGQKLNAWIDLKNTGNVTWRNYGANQIALGTEDSRDRKSAFVPDHLTRMGYLVESEVKPGDTGHFELNLEVPNVKGRVIERFTPVIENVGWLNDKALGFSATVKKPRHIAITKRLNPPAKMLPGERRRIEIEMENKGDLDWDAESMAVSLLGRGIRLFKGRAIPESPVQPGGKFTFSFWTQAPYKAGQHSVMLNSRFNRTLIRGGAARLLVTVPEPKLRAQIVEQGKRDVKLETGSTRELTVKFKNLSNAVWQKEGPNAIYLAPSRPQDRESAFYHNSWVNRFRAARMKEDEVKPGEIGTFTFNVQTNKRGTYSEYFQLVIENVGWLQGGLVRWDFNVTPPAVIPRSGAEPVLSTSEGRNLPQNSTMSNNDMGETPRSSASGVLSRNDNGEARPFRVKLSYTSDQGVFTSRTPYQVLGDDNQVLFSVRGGEEVSIRRLGDTLHAQLHDSVKTAAILRFIPSQDGIMQIASWEHRPSWNQNLNDNEFRGVIEIRLLNDKVTYINELLLEDYIKGLAEVSNDAHLEKQKAIAVLARTYARFYMQEENRKFPGLAYDGSDDPDIFQRYLGYGFEKRSPQFIGAATLTANEIVTYQGKLVKTPYFNQSDGRTRSAQEVWGWTHTPYLQSVPDPWCIGLEKKGHGVGLSGCGAEAQAKEGKTYDEIIKYYYQGVEVEELELEK